MKLVLFTPALQSSAIGKMAGLVTASLRRMGHTVQVVRAENKSLLSRPTHDFGTALISWLDTARVEAAVRDGDAVIYQVGDNFAYHEGCVRWMGRVPGVACLHDFFLGHLFTGWAQQDRSLARSVLQAWYGDEAASTFFGHRTSEEFIAATREASPMTEWIASQALAVITHSAWDVQRVLSSCAGPVRVVPLAYQAPKGIPVTAAPRERSPGEFRILTVGHVNPNKRAESVIRAIGSSDRLRAGATFALVGAVEPAAATRLSGLAAGLGVRLEVRGEVGDEELASELHRADVVCCLRWPTLEAASASTIEAMLCGKAVIVIDAGFYSELPEDCARKIDPANEVDELRRRLEELHDDSAGRLALGARAADWASGTFHADNYAGQLTQIIVDQHRSAPAINAIQSFAGQLKQWGGMQHLMSMPETTDPLRVLQNAPEHQHPPRRRS